MDLKGEIINADNIEDIAIAKAIDEGKTGEYVDIAELIKSLR